MTAGILAIPSSAMAATDCSHTGSALPVYTGGGGATGTAPLAAGVCIDGVNVAGFDGGFVEVGADPGSLEVYAVVDGSDANSDPAGQSDGYFGISNYETGSARTTQAECEASGPDNGEDGTSNSGGCIGIDGVGWVYVPANAPTPVCGNTSGNAFAGDGTTGDHDRDGCSLP